MIINFWSDLSDQYSMTLWSYSYLCSFVLRKLGDEWAVEPDVLGDLEAFTCVMYSQAWQKNQSTLYAVDCWRDWWGGWDAHHEKQVDLSRLPPCKAKLVPHRSRVTYRLALYKRAATPISGAPSPMTLTKDGRPKRTPWNQCGLVTLSSPLSSPLCSPFPHWLGGENSWEDEEPEIDFEEELLDDYIWLAYP